MHTIKFNQSYQQYIQLTRHSLRFHTKHTKITFKNSRRRHKRIVIFAQKAAVTHSITSGAIYIAKTIHRVKLRFKMFFLVFFVHLRATSGQTQSCIFYIENYCNVGP